MRHYSLLALLLLALSCAATYGQVAPGQAGPRSADDYYHRGNARAEKGDNDGAVADYTKAIEVNPRLAPAYYGRGDMRFRKGDNDGAIADLTKAVELDPRNAKAYSRRASAKSAKGDYKGAIADFTTAIEINPRSDNTYFSRAAAQYAQGDYEKAIADFTAAIAINPQYAEAYAYRGVTKMQHGETGREKLEGARDVSTALKLKPGLKSTLEELGYKIEQERAPEEGGRSVAPPSSRQGQMKLEYNVIYFCNGERMVVGHCRKDSDQPGFPATPPDKDYCQVYYPDRPKRGGYDAMAVELRGDLIRKLQACTRTAP